jgi:hypothetical protein
MKSFTKQSTLALVALGLLLLSSCNDDKFTTETIDFQSVELESETFWNGSDGSGGITLNMATFNNSYNADWAAWSGFAISNVTDTATAGWTNQYSAYIASGPNANNNYAVSYVAGTEANITFTSEVNLRSVKITNSTYAYLSILNGDEYNRKFEDGDWFLLTIVGHNSEDEILGQETFYLADFRNSASLIVDDWTKVDLSSLKGVTKIVFHLSSSDNGDWGMNTPAYFCMDDLVYTYMN